MYFIDYGCSFIGTKESTASFRTAWGMQFVPAFLLLIGIPFLPESPPWLAKVGQKEQAIHILARIQAGGDITGPLVIAEWEEIATALNAERTAVRGWRKFT
jgi:hypothetical protein